MKKLLLVLGSLGLSAAAAAQRLPENVTPERYDLKFTPDLANATFSGEETIHVRLCASASSITLNSAEIEFQEATIEAGGSKETAKVTTGGKNEIATLRVANAIPAGAAEIHTRRLDHRGARKRQPPIFSTLGYHPGRRI